MINRTFELNTYRDGKASVAGLLWKLLEHHPLLASIAGFLLFLLLTDKITPEEAMDLLSEFMHRFGWENFNP